MLTYVQSYGIHNSPLSDTDMSELGGMASFPHSFTYIEVRTSLRNIIPNILLILDYPAPALLSAGNTLVIHLDQNELSPTQSRL